MEYSLSFKYDKENKEIYTFEFTLKLDNWFELGTILENNREKKNLCRNRQSILT